MSVKIIDNTPQVKNDIDRKASLFLRFMAEDIHKASTPITPMKTGQLRRSVIKQVLGKKGQIRWDKRYAVYQEAGYSKGPIRRYTTPGTGKAFAYRAVQKGVANTDSIASKAGLR